MIAQPRRAWPWMPDTVKTIASDTPGALYIECEVIGPPSTAGRTVYVYVPEEQIVALLQSTRTAAIAQRSTPMAPHDVQRDWDAADYPGRQLPAQLVARDD